MPAPLGNRNAVKGRKLTEGLWRALAQDDWSRLRRGLDKIAEDFAAGDAATRQLVFERIEGKVVARDEGDQADVRTLTLQDVARLIYQARAADSSDVSAHLPSTDAPASQAPGGVGDIPVNSDEGAGGGGGGHSDPPSENR
jgi:hypothetical protein